MNYKNSKHIRNRRIGESEVELLYGVFAKFCDDGNKGRVCVTVKGAEFGEFSSDDRSALDAMKIRRKPVSEVAFSYRNDDYTSRVSLSIQDEFALLFSCSSGVYISIDSTDEQWFNSTWKRMEDVVDAIPITPWSSRFLNKWHGIIAVLLAITLSFCTVRILCRSAGWLGYVIPDNLLVFAAIAWGIIGMYYHSVISDFICHNYPVVDLDLYKTRSEIRGRCSRLFWWFVGVIGSLTIATYWPFGKQVSENSTTTSQSTTVSETSRDAIPRVMLKIEADDCAKQDGGEH